MPGVTAVLADYMRDDHYQEAAVLAYGTTYTVIAVFFNALWLYAARFGNLLEPVVTERRIRSRTQRYLFGILAYGVTIPLAFIEPWISIGIYTALAAFYLIPLPED